MSLRTLVLFLFVFVVKPNVQVFRAKFSEITPNSIRRACETLTEPDVNVSNAVDVRQELDLRIGKAVLHTLYSPPENMSVLNLNGNSIRSFTGAAFTRFQTLRLQKIFPTVLTNKLISYGSCQFPALGFVVERFKAIQAFIPEAFFRIKGPNSSMDLTVYRLLNVCTDVLNTRSCFVCVFSSVLHNIDEDRVEFSWKRNRLFSHTSCLVLYQRCMEVRVSVNFNFSYLCISLQYKEIHISSHL